MEVNQTATINELQIYWWDQGIKQKVTKTNNLKNHIYAILLSLNSQASSESSNS